MKITVAEIQERSSLKGITIKAARRELIEESIILKIDLLATDTEFRSELVDILHEMLALIKSR